MRDVGQNQCVCCGEPARYTVEMAIDCDWDDNEKYLLPNQAARDREAGHDDVREVPFCRACMRPVEDAVRATIRDLQFKNRRLPTRWEAQG